MLGGLALAAVALLMLGGLALLFWNNVLGPRLQAENPTPPVAQGPAAPKQDSPPALPPIIDKADPGATSSKDTPPKKKDELPKGPGGEVDIADAKKPDPPPPAPPVVAPKPKQEVEPDPKPKPGDKSEPGPKPKPDPGPPTVPVGAPTPNAPGVDAARVDAAVTKGVNYLKGGQRPDGSWGENANTIGYVGLAGLTLLECQVPAKDPVVQKAAQYIRSNLAGLNKTYDLAVALLFLDRLGEPKDRVLIQGVALRLLSGMSDSGGWQYQCPLLSVADLRQLYHFLQSHRLRGAATKPANGAGDFADNPLPQVAGLLQPPPGAGMPLMPDLMAVQLPARPNPPGWKISPYRPDGTKAPPDKGGKGGKGAPPVPVAQLPPHLQQLPVVKLIADKGWLTATKGSGDNSNTQFALLALWASRRHDVPAEYPLLLAYQRFQVTQAADGGWSYRLGLGSTNTMTCVGLLALAMGRGAVAGDAAQDKLEDPAIQNGLHALGRSVGSPSADAAAKLPMQNLYFLWSVERVAVLYNLPTIGGKDWYGWGAQILLSNQQADGNWTGGQYTGASDHTDTCFALLFLKRSNLVQDLTENLRLHMVIRDPGAK
jgi:hypothetical protein